MATDRRHEGRDDVQHGIDDNPHNDAEKGAALGGLGGAAVGAAAGSVAGPVGTVVGAVAGGLLGAGASGAAVAAVDQVDNDNTITGVGSDPRTAPADRTVVHERTVVNDTTSASAPRVVHHDTTAHTTAHPSNVRASSGAPVVDGPGGHNVVTGGESTTGSGESGLATGAIAGGLIGTAVGGPVGAVVGGTLGSLAGGVAGDAAEASDQSASYDARTGARTDRPSAAHGTSTDYRHDNTGLTSVGATDQNADAAVIGGSATPGVRADNNFAARQTGSINNDLPGVQTGGQTTAGPDTRGISEKAADAVTGDNVDDKTGGIVR